MASRSAKPASTTDLLGSPYTRESITLPDDSEGPVVATLVRLPASTRKKRGAVLHVHGFCDYFFQTATAEYFAAAGYDFYALDLRKCGRSLLPHQTPNFCQDLAEYHPELDEATRVIREEDGHERMLISAHSTGGLITALWSAELDLQGSLFLRTAGTEAINQLGQRRPYAVVPRNVSGVYAETLHRDLRGEWDFDLAWKPRESFPVRAGWLRAVRIGHRKVHRGIDVGAPVLTLCSALSSVPQAWNEEATRSDTVLDVKQIAKWPHQLGPHVTVVRVDGAIHDVLCSRKDVRDAAFDEVTRWLAYAVR